MMSTDAKMKSDVKMKLDFDCIQEDGDMGTADALRRIQPKLKVCAFLRYFVDHCMVYFLPLRFIPAILNNFLEN